MRRACLLAGFLLTGLPAAGPLHAQVTAPGRVTVEPGIYEAFSPYLYPLELPDRLYAVVRFHNNSDETFCLDGSVLGDDQVGPIYDLLEIRAAGGDPVRFKGGPPLWGTEFETFKGRRFTEIGPGQDDSWWFAMNVFYDFPRSKGDYEFRFTGRVRSYEGCMEFDEMVTTTWFSFTFDNRSLWRRIWDGFIGLFGDAA